MKSPTGVAITAMVLVVMGALAPAAQAESEGRFTGEEPSTGENSSTYLMGEDGPGGGVVLIAGEDEVACSENVFHGLILNGNDTLMIVTPTLGGSLVGQDCEAAGFPATIVNDGCELIFYTALQENIDTYDVLTAVEGCEGPGISIKAYLGSSHGFQVCEIVIPEQEGIEGVTATNEVDEEEGHDIGLDVNVMEDMQVTESGLCGSSELNASLEGSISLEGQDFFEEPLDIRISE